MSVIMSHALDFWAKSQVYWDVIQHNLASVSLWTFDSFKLKMSQLLLGLYWMDCKAKSVMD